VSKAETPPPGGVSVNTQNSLLGVGGVDADGAAGVDQLLRRVVASTDDVAAAGFVAVSLRDQRGRAILVPKEGAAQTASGELTSTELGDDNLGVAPDEGTGVALTLLRAVTSTTTDEDARHVEGGGNFLGSSRAGLRHVFHGAEKVVEKLGRAADAVEHRERKDHRVGNHILLGEFRHRIVNVLGDVERIDRASGVSGTRADGADAGTENEVGNALLMRDEQAVVEERCAGNFNVEVTSKVSGSLVGQKLFEFVAGRGVGVAGEAASDTRAVRTGIGLERVDVVGFAAAEFDFQILTGASGNRIDRKHLKADEREGVAVALRLENSLADFSARKGVGVGVGHCISLLDEGLRRNDDLDDVVGCASIDGVSH